jgi:rhombotin-1/3
LNENLNFNFTYRFCVGDKFYLCDNKILCEYDYEERLVFASMANHPILKRQASGGNSSNTTNIPTSISSPISQNNGHHHAGMMSSISTQRSQNNNDMNNNQSGINGFSTPSHMKQVISTN